MEQANVPLFRNNRIVAQAMIDAEDRPLVDPYHWRLDDRGYASAHTTREDVKTRVYMHRLIMGLVEFDGQMVDHLNHDKIDNRRSNLRICTNRVNQLNRRGANSGSGTGTRNVYWVPKLGKFKVEITAGQRHYLGMFRDRGDAERAASEARERLIGGAA